MITFKMLGRYGRFGNQMFQYATLFSIAKKNNYDFGVPFNVKSENPYQNFSLDECFPNLSAKDCSNIIPFKRVNETDFSYNEEIFNIEDGTDILGYFQSEKYFKQNKEDLLKEFKFCKKYTEEAENIKKLINEPVISVHMRLGDYKFLNDKHPVCSVDYYQRALDLLPKDLIIFAFSDEPELADSILEPLNRKRIFQKCNKYTELSLMTMCEYHVIGNSSYSWWGAWLSNSNRVISPKKWFGPSPEMPKNWSDIYCDGWCII